MIIDRNMTIYFVKSGSDMAASNPNRLMIIHKILVPKLTIIPYETGHEGNVDIKVDFVFLDSVIIYHDKNTMISDTLRYLRRTSNQVVNFREINYGLHLAVNESASFQENGFSNGDILITLFIGEKLQNMFSKKVLLMDCYNKVLDANCSNTQGYSCPDCDKYYTTKRPQILLPCKHHYCGPCAYRRYCNSEQCLNCKKSFFEATIIYERQTLELAKKIMNTTMQLCQ